MLNPVALLRSASSRSSSSRFLINSSSSKEAGYESSSDLSEEFCMFNGSHQSTLDRLWAWEKKLYEEVKVNFLNLSSHSVVIAWVDIGNHCSNRFLLMKSNDD